MPGQFSLIRQVLRLSEECWGWDKIWARILEISDSPVAPDQAAREPEIFSRLCEIPAGMLKSGIKSEERHRIN
jgi:hypothetical protein